MSPYTKSRDATLQHLLHRSHLNVSDLKEKDTSEVEGYLIMCKQTTDFNSKKKTKDWKRDGVDETREEITYLHMWRGTQDVCHRISNIDCFQTLKEVNMKDVSMVQILFNSDYINTIIN